MRWREFIGVVGWDIYMKQGEDLYCENVSGSDRGVDASSNPMSEIFPGDFGDDPPANPAKGFIRHRGFGPAKGSLCLALS